MVGCVRFFEDYFHDGKWNIYMLAVIGHHFLILYKGKEDQPNDYQDGEKDWNGESYDVSEE